MRILDFYESLIDKKMMIIVDNHQLRSYLDREGYQTILFDDYDFRNREAAFLVFSDYDYHDRLKELWNVSESRVVHLPAVKFDGSFEGIVYSLERLLEANSLNLEQGLVLRSKTYNKIAEVQGGLYLSDDRGSQLKCQLAESLEVANAEDELQAGWFYSIAELWESSVVNIKGNKSSFSVEGIFYFDGILYSANKRVIKERNQMALKALSERIASSQEKYIELEDNSVTRLVLDGRDETSALLDVELHPERQLSLTEMAFGCNTGIVNCVDWEVNSVMNEGIYGMHLGTGIPNKSPHIDFISKTLKLV
ncbi:hypothetical protein [Moorena sp. SIO4G3]|uniref:hypothetical protein n=1 Tax=Moorena sp. SIO4G3 TaxID=2607821 RepID=UPI00142BDA4E|nr:hypothetical protein [Moorena sp. SIO4G3]NEO75447.1 hypothetical protein [Moorena sp. SIO4G3]